MEVDGNTHSTPAENAKLTEKDITGLKYFDQIAPLLQRLHDDACDCDTAGNRTLHYDQYCMLMLLYFVNPIVTSLRGLQQASELKNVQAKPGCRHLLSHKQNGIEIQTYSAIIARFIGQVITDENASRRAEDIGGQEVSYAEVKAIASGNPAVLTLSEADAELQRLAILRKNHFDEQYIARRQVRDLLAIIRNLRERLTAATR